MMTIVTTIAGVKEMTIVMTIAEATAEDVHRIHVMIVTTVAAAVACQEMTMMMIVVAEVEEVMVADGLATVKVIAVQPEMAVVEAAEEEAVMMMTAMTTEVPAAAVHHAMMMIAETVTAEVVVVADGSVIRKDILKQLKEAGKSAVHPAEVDLTVAVQHAAVTTMMMTVVVVDVVEAATVAAVTDVAGLEIPGAMLKQLKEVGKTGADPYFKSGKPGLKKPGFFVPENY
jgi:hypothetical protein